MTSSTVLDYAWQRPAAATLAGKTAGVVRYLSHDPGKDITPREYADLQAHGIPVALVWETTARRAGDGWNAGEQDAQEVARRVHDLVGGEGPVYFAVDWDVTSLEASAICANYLGAAHRTLGYTPQGLPRTGVYGGWKMIDAAHRTGFHYLWQTLAWSNGAWHPAALLAQAGQAVFDDIRVDVNYPKGDDWGQYPRTAPRATAPAWPGRELRLVSPPLRGNDVSRWQEQMLRRGWRLPVTGVYDAHTRDVCVDFQKEKGFKPDGIVGPITWAGAWTAPLT